MLRPSSVPTGLAFCALLALYLGFSIYTTHSPNHSLNLHRLIPSYPSFLSKLNPLHSSTTHPSLPDLPEPLPPSLSLGSPLTPLHTLCHSPNTTWNHKLIWRCDHLSGGTSNLYNQLLNCVRVAIAAGAISFIPPKIWRRDQDEPIRVITGNKSDLVSLSYMFDYSYFKHSLTEACPALKLYESVGDVPGLIGTGSNKGEGDIRYAALRPRDLARAGWGAPWREKFDAWLDSLRGTAGGSYSYQTYDVVLAASQMFAWPVWEDGEEFAEGFGRGFVRFEGVSRGLAAVVLEGMAKSYGEDDGVVGMGDEYEYDEVDEFDELGRRDGGLSTPAPPVPSTSPQSSPPPPPSPFSTTPPFFGAHLRTGPDLGPEWSAMPFSTQYSSYVSTALAHNLSLLYLGSGVASDCATFKSRAKLEHNITVITKEDILSRHAPHLLPLLASLTSDQAAIIDFEVLSRATYFGGMHRSSFAWQIVWRRHAWSRLGLEEVVRTGKGWNGTEERKRDKVFEDEFSHVLNTEGTVFDFFLWGTWG